MHIQEADKGIKMKDTIFHGTTILALRQDNAVVVAGDGQVTLGSIVTKHRAKKVRRIYNDKIITGFAGATADALTLSEKLEKKLERYNGSLTRACVELARDVWGEYPFCAIKVSIKSSRIILPQPYCRKSRAHKRLLYCMKNCCKRF